METMFDEERLMHALLKMQRVEQLAFATACCERMFPKDEPFEGAVRWADFARLRVGLDTAWEACQGERASEAALRELIWRYELSPSGAGAAPSHASSSAQAAEFAVCALLEFLLDESLDSIVSVAALSVEWIEGFVAQLRGLDPRHVQRDPVVLKHPLMQQELARQRRDLAQASSISKTGAALQALRAQAQGEFILALGPEPFWAPLHECGAAQEL
jgi:uncharacterized protein